jgi:hypothetical protein
MIFAVIARKTDDPQLLNFNNICTRPKSGQQIALFSPTLFIIGIERVTIRHK